MAFSKNGLRGPSRTTSVTASQRLSETKILRSRPCPKPFPGESMQAVSFPARQARTHYRHELRTLTYVTVDNANGGIIRNLNHLGVAVHAVPALRPQQRVHLRFELKFPRLRVETAVEVSWTRPSGQCGIRFVNLPAGTRHQINALIFSNLLDAIARNSGHPGSIFGASVVSIAREENAPQETTG